jgi:hypothetical protein
VLAHGAERQLAANDVTNESNRASSLYSMRQLLQQFVTGASDLPWGGHPVGRPQFIEWWSLAVFIGKPE